MIEGLEKVHQELVSVTPEAPGPQPLSPEGMSGINC